MDNSKMLDNGKDGIDNVYGPAVEDTGWVPKLFNTNYRTTQLVSTKKNGKTLTCLRHPRDLYALSKLTIPINIRWPTELLQIHTPRPFHILYTPLKQEPLLKKEKNAKENMEKSMNVFGKVVFDNTPDPEIKYFSSSKPDARGTVSKLYYTSKDKSDKTLLFESRFESGNLMRAIKVGEYDYQLWINFDLYTKKHTQWFYFRIQNTHPNITYRFTIMNLLKSGSLYNDGMKPLLYSEKDALEKNIGWIRAGSSIKYYRNDIRVDGKERYYYSLHWSCTFANENDTYYFAHSYPYTYSDLQEYLAYLASDSQRRRYCKQRVLCQSLAGNHIYVLTITAPTKCPKLAKIKKVIVVTARVHPGETVASWMMKGLLDFLTSNEPDAKILRDTFIFKIIPMLNPDGVIVGNYRCSLSGRDLNRNYKTVLKDSFPSVWTTKMLVKRLQEDREVVLYCDFHGHSRKKDVFIYGCEDKQDKNASRFHSRIFPLILSKNAPDQFSYNNCRFRVQKSKEGTGRVVMWNMGIKYSYTLEASFCGSSSTDNRNRHFCVQDYEAIGYHFCDGLLDLFDPDITKFKRLEEEIEQRIRSALVRKMFITGQMEKEDTDISQLEFISDVESDSIGSDSSVSDGLPMQLLHASIPDTTKRKKLRSRKERNNHRKRLKKHRRINMESTKEALLKYIASSEISPTKVNELTNKSMSDNNIKQQIQSKECISRVSYITRQKEPFSRIHRSPCNLGANDYLDSFAYSYVQAGLIDGLLKEDSNTHRLLSSSFPCERCNAAPHLSFEESDDELVMHKSHDRNYSLFDIRKSNKTNEINPTLDLARRITAYNYRNGKVPPRISKMFAIWSGDDQKREKLMKRKTSNEGDNIEYLRKGLENYRIDTQSCSSTRIRPQELCDFSPEQKSLSSLKPEDNSVYTIGKSELRFEANQRTRQVDISLTPHDRRFSSYHITHQKILPKLNNKVLSKTVYDGSSNQTPVTLYFCRPDMKENRKRFLHDCTYKKDKMNTKKKDDNMLPQNSKHENARGKILADRLKAFGGSGCLSTCNDSILDQVIDQCSGLIRDVPSMDDGISLSTIETSTQDFTTCRQADLNCDSPSERRAISPQQYFMFSDDNSQLEDYYSNIENN